MTKKPASKPKLHGIVIRRLYGRVIAGFIVVVCLLVGIILFVAFATTTITITAENRPVDVESTIQLANKTDDEKADSDQPLPAKLLATRLTVTTTYDELTATQTEPAKASGTIRIFNNYSRLQPLVAGTRLLAPDGHLFRTTEFVEVPVGSYVDASVEADQLGKEYEIDPTTFILPAIWPGIQDKIYGESSTAMVGGERKVSIVTEDDLSKAKAAAETKALTEAAAALQVEVTKAEPLALVQTKAIRLTTLDQEISAAIGDTVDAITITDTLRAETVLVDERLLYDRTVEDLQASVDATERLASVDENSFDYALSAFDAAAGTAEIQTNLSGSTQLDLAQPALKPTRFTGKRKADIEQTIRALPGVTDVKVSFGFLSFFRSSMSPDRIRIVVTDGQ